MTREERKKAIEVLDDMKVKIDIPKAAKTQNDRNWALDVAIQALSQEPITTTNNDEPITIIYPTIVCDNTISREAVLKKIDDEVEHYCKYLEEVDDKRNTQTHVALVSDNIREEVEQLPSVNPQLCDDMISREMALNSLIDNTHLDGYDLAEALDAIENKEKLPPVTQKGDVKNV